jgi:hypothetical protein
MGNRPAEYNRLQPARSNDLEQALDEVLRAEQPRCPESVETFFCMVRFYSGALVHLPSIVYGKRPERAKPFQWEEPMHSVVSSTMVYKVESPRGITKSQVLNIVAASVGFGLGLGLFVASLLSKDIGNVAPWFFWSIPMLGSGGLVLGIVLNLSQDKVFHETQER